MVQDLLVLADGCSIDAMASSYGGHGCMVLFYVLMVSFLQIPSTEEEIV